MISWLFLLICSAERGSAAGGVTSDSAGRASSRPGRALRKGHGDSSLSYRDSAVLEKVVLLNGQMSFSFEYSYFAQSSVLHGKRF